MDLCNISVIMFVFTLLKCMQIENRKNQTNRVFVVPSRVRVKTKIAFTLIIVLKEEKQMNNLKMTPSVANWMNLVCRVSYCFCVGLPWGVWDGYCLLYTHTGITHLLASVFAFNYASNAPLRMRSVYMYTKK